MRPMLGRAIVAFAALPGIVAFAIPAALVGGASPLPSSHPIGLAPASVGIVVLLWSVREFYVVGRGTLAPWEPPRRLVVSGPYRYCRNPMYGGVALMLVGWATLYWSVALLLYAVAVAIAFHVRVVLAEEPFAAQRFGGDWDAYQARTPRWLF